jgi:hypothetical protein
MPPDLGFRYPPTWPGNPPHMSLQDIPLWVRCRDRFSTRVTDWYFDAAVGEGAGPGPNPSDSIALAYYRLTRKRIDAVGDAGSTWLLLELRPNAGLGALGSIQTYRSLWERDPPDSRPVEAWLITDRGEPDTLRTAINAGVRFLLV